MRLCVGVKVCESVCVCARSRECGGRALYPPPTMMTRSGRAGRKQASLDMIPSSAPGMSGCARPTSPGPKSGDGPAWRTGRCGHLCFLRDRASRRPGRVGPDRPEPGRSPIRAQHAHARTHARTSGPSQDHSVHLHGRPSVTKNAPARPSRGNQCHPARRVRLEHQALANV